ncbi:hypothetical protein [Ovoidimarina sediminis]|uniref:hypothetical protein n=1 Tax=Ovoidimarina sediminis TaxID=3079856 RepID=UPI00290FEA90|nr:hypothetical protein [Rhodophyticola sp. MJ-SS7]MDU8945157.1 hypothetical protein [Rhodophyticola sp. MJ-SS7]
MVGVRSLLAIFAPERACGALCRAVEAEVEAMRRADALDARRAPCTNENAPR